MTQRLKLNSLARIALKCAHGVGWQVIIFLGIGRDNSNILLLLTGTVVMLVSLVILCCRPVAGYLTKCDPDTAIRSRKGVAE